MSRFVGELEVSKSNVHKVLIYKLTKKPGKCFRFTWIRKNMYCCQRCKNAKKSNKSITVNSIPVEGNVFLRDPEEIEHSCNPFSCEESAAIRIYR